MYLYIKQNEKKMEKKNERKKISKWANQKVINIDYNYINNTIMIIMITIQYVKFYFNPM